MSFEIDRRRIECEQDRVIVNTPLGTFNYPKNVQSLKTDAKISKSKYVLVEESGKIGFALSSKQELNGLNFNQMNIKALKEGLLLARVQDFTPHLRNVNLALQGEGVLYDASGNLIEGERLKQCGKAVNNAWVYLNNAYETGRGFLGLDVISIAGLDAEGNLKVERQPLEKCVVNCWADILGLTNSQGYYTEKAPIQRFELGRTVYIHTPQEGCVARFNADSVGANLGGSRNPQIASSGLGGFLRAEGTAQKIGDSK